MASSLYAALSTSDDSSPISRTRQGVLNRWNSLAESTGSWTNPFLSRFHSLSTGIGSLTRSSTAATSAIPASSIPASELVHNSFNDYEATTKGKAEEEEETVGLVASAQTPSKDPFDDANAVKAAKPKPLWHRGITAAAILAGLIALGLGLGLGIKKITNKVEESEAARMSSSLAMVSTSFSTNQRSSSSTSFTSVPSSQTSPSSSSETHSQSSTVLPPSTTSSPTTTPIGNDIFWAVAKTA